MQTLTVSDIVSICTATISLLTVMTSIVIAVLTLRQNSRMLEEESRPYISVYGEITFFQDAHYYIVVKNFGRSGGIIESFEVSPSLPKDGVSRTPFQHMTGTTVAPGQAFRALIDVKNTDVMLYEFSIRYRWGKRIYTDTVTVNVEAHADILLARASTEGKELRTISYTLQDLVERQL